MTFFKTFKVGDYVDLDYMLWLRWLLSPLVITFVILPLVILFFIYLSSLILYVYKHREGPQRLVEAVEQRDFYHAGRLLVAAMWDYHGWVWHGYQVTTGRSTEHGL